MEAACASGGLACAEAVRAMEANRPIGARDEQRSVSRRVLSTLVDILLGPPNWAIPVMTPCGVHC